MIIWISIGLGALICGLIFRQAETIGQRIIAVVNGAIAGGGAFSLLSVVASVT